MEVQEAFEKLTKGKLVEGYGLTEASPVTHANPLGGNRKVGSIGVPLPSTEAAVVDLVHGRKKVKTGQIGELAVRGPQVMLGYWRNESATREVLTSDGWLLTGDVAQMDEDGYFRIIARKADMWYASRPNRARLPRRRKPAFPRDVEEVHLRNPAGEGSGSGGDCRKSLRLRHRGTRTPHARICPRLLQAALAPASCPAVRYFHG